MSKARIYVAWVAIFLSGAIVGGLVTAAAIKLAIIRQIEGGPEAARAMAIRVLKRELSLTAQQVPDVKRIVDATHEELMGMRDRNQPEMDAILGRSVDAMKKVLTLEQQKKLDDLYWRTRSHWAAARGTPSAAP